jgi:hypothetical protein
MHPAGLPFVGVSLALAAVGRRQPWLRRAGLLSAGANAAFFRHPRRTPPTRPGVVVAVVIRTPDGVEVIAVQIAGLIARRIVCEAKVGDKVSIGDTYGLIRFGSRLDTYLPEGSNILVNTGQRALAGETVLAELPR